MIDAAELVTAHYAMLAQDGKAPRVTLARVPGIDGSVALDPARILVIKGKARGANTAPAVPTEYVLRSGRWTIDKAADADLFYGIDASAVLALTNTTITKVQAVAMGVTETVPAFIANPAGIVGIKVSGIDTSPDAINLITFMLTCANTEVITQTIYFRHKDQ